MSAGSGGCSIRSSSSISSSSSSSLQKASARGVCLREGGANSVGHCAVEHVEGQIKVDQRFAAPDGIVDGSNVIVEAQAVAYERAVVFKGQELACKRGREVVGRERTELKVNYLPERPFPVTSRVVRADFAPLMTSSGSDP
jgi:hypothetical protein